MRIMSQSSIYDLLTQIYGADTASKIEPGFQNLIENYRGRIPTPAVSLLTEHDAMLITYGDQVRSPGQPHLQTLAQFCQTRLHSLVSSIHILPFYPWSSDDGFSVKRLP
jgi:glucosylglycerate phosphorylase